MTERTFDCDGALVFDRETGKYLPDVAVDDAEFVQADQETDYDREQEGVQDTGAEPATVEKYSIVRDSNSNYHGEISLFEPTPIPAIPPLPGWPWKLGRIR